MASSEELVAPVLGPSEVGAPTASRGRSHSYGQILKSSARIGGSSVLKIGLRIVCAKALGELLEFA